MYPVVIVVIKFKEILAVDIERSATMFGIPVSLIMKILLVEITDK